MKKIIKSQKPLVPLCSLEEANQQFINSLPIKEDAKNSCLTPFIFYMTGLIKSKIPFTFFDFLSIIKSQNLPDEEIKMLFKKYVQIMRKNSLLKVTPPLVMDEEIYQAI